jgi:hypothetical protein
MALKTCSCSSITSRLTYSAKAQSFCLAPFKNYPRVALFQNNLSFIETSALDSTNVETAFHNILTGEETVPVTLARLGEFSHFGRIFAFLAIFRILGEFLLHFGPKLSGEFSQKQLQL